MASARRNLQVVQGETFGKIFTWKTGTPAAPVNLTGKKAALIVTHSATGTAIFLSLTTENGGITLGGVLGTITLAMKASATALLAAGEYVYRLSITEPAVLPVDDVVTILTHGKFTISVDGSK